MNREIKFRAWLKEHKEMRKVNAIKWENDTITLIAGISAPYAEVEGWCDLFPFGEIVLMQYTGFKNKNGIEVYEDDVLKGNDGQNFYEKVWWNEKEAKYMRGEHGIELHENIEELEVVGNIHEHPYLLELNEHE